MKNLNNKTKKWLTVTGCIALSAVLVVMIGAQLKKEPVEDALLPTQSTEISDVRINPNDEPQISEEDEVEVIPPEIPDTTQNGNGAVSTGTEQTIQGDVTKPEEPSEDVKNDPTQKPNGEKVTESPTPVDYDKVEKPTEPPEKDNEPQGGDTKDGKIYVPGFGWRTPTGGEGTTVDGDGDINKQVGTMD